MAADGIKLYSLPHAAAGRFSTLSKCPPRSAGSRPICCPLSMISSASRAPATAAGACTGASAAGIARAGAKKIKRSSVQWSGVGRRQAGLPSRRCAVAGASLRRAMPWRGSIAHGGTAALMRCRSGRFPASMCARLSQQGVTAALIEAALKAGRRAMLPRLKPIPWTQISRRARRAPASSRPSRARIQVDGCSPGPPTTGQSPRPRRREIQPLGGKHSRQLKTSTVRATSPAFIARNASLMSLSRPRRLIIPSRSSRPWR